MNMFLIYEAAGEITNVDFSTIRSSTDNFSDENKLGKGGFGEVYRVGKHYDTKIIINCLSKFIKPLYLVI